jgi:hypothetical protein
MVGVLLCCLIAVCVTTWGQRQYGKVQPAGPPPGVSSKVVDSPLVAAPAKTKPVMRGLDVEVTTDPIAYDRECRAAGLDGPHAGDGTLRGSNAGLRGRIDEVNFCDRTVKISVYGEGSRDLRPEVWVPIRALRGLESWSWEQERLHLQGATGEYADVANGSYTLSQESHRGQPVWRKDGGAGDKWLVRFGNGLWYLTSTERLLADQAGGWMESTRQDANDPGRAGPWRVWTGLTWELQCSVAIDRFRLWQRTPTVGSPGSYSGFGGSIEDVGRPAGFSHVMPSYVG